MRESGGIFHRSLSTWPSGTNHVQCDTDLLDGILRLKDRGEMGRDLRREVYPCIFVLVVEVYDYARWVPDSVDEMSGDHFVRERSLQFVGIVQL